MIDANRPEEKKRDVTLPGEPASNHRMVSAVLDQGHLDRMDEDAIQIERFLKGEVRAFDGLYSKYYDRVYAIARGVLLDAEEAADTVQEIFTLVHKNLYKFDKRAKFSTWLFRIAVNRSIQDSRKKRRRPLTVELMEIAQYQSEPGKESDPRVQLALSKLRPEDRALLLLYYWEELSLQDIAHSISSSVNATKTRLYRAREKFKEKYEEEKS